MLVDGVEGDTDFAEAAFPPKHLLDSCCRLLLRCNPVVVSLLNLQMQRR